MPRLNISAVARAFRLGVALLLLWSPGVYAQTAAKSSASERATPEQRAARAFEAARANPLDLHAFLLRMPKGADLHYHLSGGIYAESFIRVAAEEGLCVDLASHSFVRPAAAVPSAAAPPICRAGEVAAPEA